MLRVSLSLFFTNNIPSFLIPLSLFEEVLDHHSERTVSFLQREAEVEKIWKIFKIVFRECDQDFG